MATVRVPVLWFLLEYGSFLDLVHSGSINLGQLPRAPSELQEAELETLVPAPFSCQPAALT